MRSGKGKRMIPLVVKPSVRPIKYYDVVGDVMVEFMRNRRVAIIQQTNTEARLITRVRHEDGTPLPIIINDKEELIRYVKSGGIDFMTSIGNATSKNADTLIIDIKGGRKAWLTIEGLRAMNIAIMAVKAVFEGLGLSNNVVVFDGMNGFKVISKLSSEVGDDVIQGFIRIVTEGVPRGLKGIEVFRSYEDDIIIGGNTMIKVRMFRVPLSLHWSTKLSAIPITDVESFLSKNADPSNVVMSMSLMRKLLEPLSRLNPVDSLLDFVGKLRVDDVDVIYKIKHMVKASLASLMRN
ncbi:hypothetical protein [Vulcanisaeta thermophila]|uniref:hypothetical protein n=1 Tax=Vulcanisaeta thermophila TaxID=867917 RepID=UPI0008529521|nr:hypothetical protein [Vulcanisaeta thermophila]